MYYLKCKHCNHLNEVKSEYLVVCGLCNRKLEDNYKDWKVKHPEKSFEDFQREVCLTEEQVKAETSRCLSCGASVVDPNKCIGCGVCTTKCVFDAIHLHRELPGASVMRASEDKLKYILPNMVKQSIKVKFAKKK